MRKLTKEEIEADKALWDERKGWKWKMFWVCMVCSLVGMISAATVFSLLF